MSHGGERRTWVEVVPLISSFLSESSLETVTVVVFWLSGAGAGFVLLISGTTTSTSFVSS